MSGRYKGHIMVSQASSSAAYVRSEEKELRTGANYLLQGDLAPDVIVSPAMIRFQKRFGLNWKQKCASLQRGSASGLEGL